MDNDHTWLLVGVGIGIGLILGFTSVCIFAGLRKYLTQSNYQTPPTQSSYPNYQYFQQYVENALSNMLMVSASVDEVRRQQRRLFTKTEELQQSLTQLDKIIEQPGKQPNIEAQEMQHICIGLGDVGDGMKEMQAALSKLKEPHQTSSFASRARTTIPATQKGLNTTTKESNTDLKQIDTLQQLIDSIYTGALQTAATARLCTQSGTSFSKAWTKELELEVLAETLEMFGSEAKSLLQEIKHLPTQSLQPDAYNTHLIAHFQQVDDFALAWDALCIEFNTQLQQLQLLYQQYQQQMSLPHNTESLPILPHQLAEELNTIIRHMEHSLDEQVEACEKLRADIIQLGEQAKSNNSITQKRPTV